MRWVVLVFVLGCSGGLPALPGDGDASLDAGTSDEPFAPAAHAAFPRDIVYADGGVLAPHVVPVFFANDTLQSGVEGLLAELPSSSYWQALEAEYGVGALSVGASIVLTDSPPANASSDQVAAFIASKLDSDPSWPAPTPDTIYFVYYPSSTTLLLGPLVSCVGFLGYHSYGQTSSNVTFVFAVQARCTADQTLSELDEATQNTTHEIVEAATDPLLTTYGEVDPAHAVWGLYPGEELGDLCELESLSYQRLVGTNLVARFWSNAAASAGHDPCAPALSLPYFNSVPVLPDEIPVDFGYGLAPTKGVVVPLGQSKTIDVQLFSDAPTTAWLVEADDSSSWTAGASPELTFAWDKTAGNNGDTLELTITRVAKGALGGTEFVVYSFVTQTTWHEYFGFAGN